MARTMDQSKLDKVKKALKDLTKGNVNNLEGISAQKVADKSGVPFGVVGGYMYLAEPQVFPSLKFKETGAALNRRIVKARDDEGLRWERIAARAGKTVGEVQAAYQSITKKDPKKSYTGRGRNFSDSSATSRGKSTSSSRKSGGGQRGASGRRQAAAGNKAGGGQAKPRNRTRADRQAAGRNPS